MSSLLLGLFLLSFKTPTELKEFKVLHKYNKPLKEAILSATETKCKVTITDLYRSKKDQKRIYGRNTKRKSNHMYWKAVDIRTKGIRKGCINKFVKHFKDRGFKTIVHKGTAMHLHVENKWTKN